MPNWTDPTTVHVPAAKVAPPPAWGLAINDDLLHLFERIERVISDTVLPGASTGIGTGTLPDVPNGWGLRIRAQVRHASSTGQDALLRFNGDTGNNYSRQAVFSSDTTAAAAEATGTSGIGIANAGNESASRWSVGEFFVFDYKGSGHKSGVGSFYSPASLSTMLVATIGGLWASTSPITSASITANTGNFAAGSRLTVSALPLPV